ncbi:MAG: threonine/serine dehydratase [Oscillospiraceae bacterium]|nr:threonine/serine dehydratase [Oscillospiraceae bacterium]
MSLTVREIKAARDRIAPYIVRTPLLRMNNLDQFLGCEVYVKAECMQTTGSFKLRGAMNRILSLSEEELQRGIVAASSGNHGKAVAYACKKLGTKATIILPNTVAEIKENTIRQWGAEIVKCEVSERLEVAEKLCQERNAVLVPPFNDEAIMAGQGTAGLEIMEQCPELDTVIVPASGGGLIGGVATAIKSLSPGTAVFGAEPAALPRYSASLKAGKPVLVEKKSTVADALVSQIPGSVCFPYVAAHTDGFADVDEEYILRGMKLLLTEGKLLCEPSSGISIGAVLQGLIPVRQTDKVCFFISGGSVSLEQLHRLESI